MQWINDKKCIILTNSYASLVWERNLISIRNQFFKMKKMIKMDRHKSSSWIERDHRDARSRDVEKLKCLKDT
jgi:hypothetical protein